MATRGMIRRLRFGKTYHLSPESLNLGILLVGGAKVAEVCHGDRRLRDDESWD